MSTNPNIPEEYPVQENTAPNQSPGDTTLWNKPAPVNPRTLFPKKKHRWGLIEVTNSLVILVVLQIILSLVIIARSVTESLGRGVETDDVNTITQNVMESVTSPTMIIVSSMLMYGSWLFMMWYSTRFRGYRNWAKDFWLKFKTKDILWGLGLAAVLVVAVQGITMGLDALGVDISGTDNTTIFKGHGIVWELILMIGLVGIVGPIMEELFFRGFLLQGLIRHFRRGNVHEPRSAFGSSIQQFSAGLFNAYLTFRNWCYRHKYTLSIIISSTIFGFMHFQGTEIGHWLVVLITGLLGAVFAIVAVKTQRISIGIYGHIFYNSTVAILSMAMG